MRSRTHRPVRSGLAQPKAVIPGGRVGKSARSTRAARREAGTDLTRVQAPVVATIRDVARAAGVSIATVSRVLNGSARVRETTDREVRHAAKRLNYWPNGAARSLITNRTNTIGVLLPDLHGEFFSEVIRGIDLASRRAGLHLLVSSSHAATDELVAALRSMRGRIDGLIVMAPEVAAPRLVRECAMGATTVLLNPGRSVRGCHAISIANQDGAYRLVKHLVALGHRRIATVTGPDGNSDARQRLEGYRAALLDAGIRVPVHYELRGDFQEPSGAAAGRRLLRLTPRPTAVFVGNDRMAVGVMGVLKNSGLRLPDDMAIAGFDDIEVAKYLDPPLTTVHADAYRLGEHAVERLLLANDETRPSEEIHEIFPTTVVVRASCGSRTGTDTRLRLLRRESAAGTETASSGSSTRKGRASAKAAGTRKGVQP